MFIIVIRRFSVHIVLHFGIHIGIHEYIRESQWQHLASFENAMFYGFLIWEIMRLFHKLYISYQDKHK